MRDAENASMASGLKDVDKMPHLNDPESKNSRRSSELREEDTNANCPEKTDVIMKDNDETEKAQNVNLIDGNVKPRSSNDGQSVYVAANNGNSDANSSIEAHGVEDGSIRQSAVNGDGTDSISGKHDCRSIENDDEEAIETKEASLNKSSSNDVEANNVTGKSSDTIENLIAGAGLKNTFSADASAPGAYSRTQIGKTGIGADDSSVDFEKTVQTTVGTADDVPDAPVNGINKTSFSNDTDPTTRNDVVVKATSTTPMTDPFTALPDLAVENAGQAADISMAVVGGTDDAPVVATDGPSALSSVLPVSSDALPTMSDVLPVTSDVLPITSDVPPVASDVPPITSDVPPVASDVPPITSDVPPVASDVLPVTSDVPPVTSDVPPITSDIPPVTSDIPPITSDVPPITSDVLPITSDIPPVTSAVPPITSDVPPITSDVPPITSDVPPITSDVPPITSDVPPVTSDVPPVTSDVPPVTSDVPPVTSDVPPVTGDVPPVTSDASFAMNDVHSAMSGAPPAMNDSYVTSIAPLGTSDGPSATYDASTAMNDVLPVTNNATLAISHIPPVAKNALVTSVVLLGTSDVPPSMSSASAVNDVSPATSNVVPVTSDAPLVTNAASATVLTLDTDSMIKETGDSDVAVDPNPEDGDDGRDGSDRDNDDDDDLFAGLDDVATMDLYSISNYTFGKKDCESKSKLMRDLPERAISEALRQDYDRRGLRRSVRGVVLAHEHNFAHLLLLQRSDGKGEFSLPGGRLRPGENFEDGLLRKLSAKLCAIKADETDQTTLEIGDKLGKWFAIDFTRRYFPYVPAHVTKVKEEVHIYAVSLPSNFKFSVPKNLQLVAVPLCDVHNNLAMYGSMISAIPALLSRFHINFC